MIIYISNLNLNSAYFVLIMIESFVKFMSKMGKLLFGFDRLLKTIRLWLGLCSTVGPIEKRLGPERGGGRCKKGPKECWGGGGAY